jgi:hypothetical protein
MNINGIFYIPCISACHCNDYRQTGIPAELENHIAPFGKTLLNVELFHWEMMSKRQGQYKNISIKQFHC